MIVKIKKILNQTGFMRYLKNTSWLMGEKIIRLIVALSVGVLVTRYLGPEQFGILSYAQSFVAIFAAFSTLGLTDIVMRELIKSQDKKNELLGTSFILQTFGSLFIMICLTIAIIVNDNSPLTNKIIIILGLITFLNSFGVIGAFFNSTVNSRKIALPSLIGLIISSILKIILIFQEASLIYFVYLLAFDIAFLTFGQIWYYQREGFSIFQWKFSWSVAKELLKDSWPLVLSSIVISIYMKIDQVMIQEIMGNSAVGQYSAAVRLSEAWYFIPMIICSSLFPAIVNAKMKDHNLYMDRLQRLYDLMVILGYSIVIPVLLFSKWGINFLYGDAFALAAPVLNIHIWAGVFVFLGVANQKWFISENLQAYNILCLGFGMVANIVLNLVLIPKQGILGAAYATLISQFIASVLAPIFFNKTRESFFMMLKSIFLVNYLKLIFKR
ncbi:flippase [Cellulophaga tyrosinoxydans]|uniref:Membrane protein involved in the export of O-antigen and teichoic acid n=1 Tax=Cellulophaga tyrosinoxydans TaxID=504486 RepID=A0A1W2A2Q4_9FLAO|nr:flippase [Cellulophaga tyrosinoxydans]SMC54896.1 Membrane protein involved in the export of O-antigen and teichoic acid [Cellulophaga tyrosinoxydans]